MPTLMIFAQIITGSCKTPITSLGKVKFGVLVFSHLSMIFIYFRRSRESTCLRFKKANPISITFLTLFQSSELCSPASRFFVLAQYPKFNYPWNSHTRLFRLLCKELLIKWRIWCQFRRHCCMKTNFLVGFLETNCNFKKYCNMSKPYLKRITVGFSSPLVFILTTWFTCDAIHWANGCFWSVKT